MVTRASRALSGGSAEGTDIQHPKRYSVRKKNKKQNLCSVAVFKVEFAFLLSLCQSASRTLDGTLPSVPPPERMGSLRRQPHEPQQKQLETLGNNMHTGTSNM